MVWVRLWHLKIMSKKSRNVEGFAVIIGDVLQEATVRKRTVFWRVCNSAILICLSFAFIFQKFDWTLPVRFVCSVSKSIFNEFCSQCRKKIKKMPHLLFESWKFSNTDGEIFFVFAYTLLHRQLCLVVKIWLHSNELQKLYEVPSSSRLTIHCFD